MGKKTPKAPDPVATANAQAAANKDTAVFNAALNRINQYTPYGNSIYATNGKDENGVPIYSQTTTLAPEQQKLLDLQNQQDLALGNTSNSYLNQINQSANTPFSYGGIAKIPGSEDLNAYRQQVTNDIYTRLQPQFERDQKSLDAKLANQGIMQGSEAYNNDYNLFNQAKNDALVQADLQSGQQMQQLFNMGLQNRQQGIDEYNQQRQAPVNEFNALRGQAQIQSPTFSAIPQVGATAPDIQGAINNAYNVKASGANSRNAAISQLAGTALGSAAGFGGGSGSLFGYKAWQ